MFSFPLNTRLSMGVLYISVYHFSSEATPKGNKDNYVSKKQAI